jgi:hypothetical protein
MKAVNFFWLCLTLITLDACDNSKEIEKLLNSNEKNDVILGAYMAGEKKDKLFIPLLLKNADDPRTSHELRFKGLSVYQQKMTALRKIFNVEAPVKITYRPDSTVIKFYSELASQIQ